MLCGQFPFHCVKSVRIWCFSGPYFPPFGLNTERYGSLTALTHLNLLLQSYDPIIHIMYEALRRRVLVLIGRLFTPRLVKKVNTKGLRWE